MNIKNKIQNLFTGPNFWPRVIVVLVVLILVLTSFQLGKMVGYRQAGFANRLGDNYRRTFAEQGRWPNKFDLPPPERGLPNSHGAVGKVIKMSDKSFIISTPENVEKTIIVSTDTLVKKFRDAVKVTDLQSGDMVVILGEPNDSGEVVAKLIRIMPTPEK
jgi:hypothetical protein